MKKGILTKREREVFELLINNYDTNEIAKALKISDKTVRNHISNAMQKLGVKGRAGAVIELLKLGELSFLNLGDLSIDGERRLITAYPNLTADIIKVAHHGSNTSTSELLLEQLRPQLALISAGENNRYGHPHAEVLQRLQFFNIPTLATNDVGAIKITYNPIWGYSITTALEME